MIGVSDGDGDRLPEEQDRSVGVLNPEPLEGDGDGFANACDFHQNGIRDSADFHTPPARPCPTSRAVSMGIGHRPLEPEPGSTRLHPLQELGDGLRPA